MAEYSFKKHKLSAAEERWLREVSDAAYFDPRVAKVKLLGILPDDFDHRKIDKRFLSDGHITPLGRWYLNHDDQFIKTIDQVVVTIRKMILEQPGISEIESKHIGGRCGLDGAVVGQALYDLGKLGHFYSGASGASASHSFFRIELRGDTVYDEYLRYKGLEDLLESFYTSNNPSEAVPAFTWGYTGGSFSDLEIAGKYQPLCNKEIKPNTAFVLMAMDSGKPELVDVYSAIKDVCREFEINAYRADDIEHQDRITDLILKEISTCEFLIADLTFERPNVYYEVGYAHALSKKPILYRKTGTSLHFDLAVHNVPEYKNVTELRDMLRRRFEAILGRSAKEKSRS